MDVDYNEASGIRIVEDLEGLSELDIPEDYGLVRRSSKKERSGRSQKKKLKQRLARIKECYVRAQRLEKDEIRRLLDIPRYKRNITNGKNWTVSEDLIILTSSGTREELARRLLRSSESIRKRWMILRRYGLERKI